MTRPLSHLTHALVWLDAGSEKLGRAARRRIDGARAGDRSVREVGSSTQLRVAVRDGRELVALRPDGAVQLRLLAGEVRLQGALAWARLGSSAASWGRARP